MKFINYLHNLKTPDNENIIAIVESGYQAIFEYPHVVMHDDEYADLYVEKANAQGNRKALGYISYLIRSLMDNKDIIIPDEFLVSDETNKIEHPKESIEYPSVDILITQLEKLKEKLTQQLN